MGRLRYRSPRSSLKKLEMVVADIARKQIRKGNLVVPESVAALPMFAELVVADSATEAWPPGGRSDLEIIVGGFVIRASAGADEGQSTRAICAARAAES